MKFSFPLNPGEVALVGAGPGAADLLTVAAVKLIGDCDAIVFDALVSEDGLNLAAVGAELIEAGKRGDPFVFGRGGEEIRALASAWFIGRCMGR